MFVFGMIGAVLRDRKGISAMEYAILAAAVLTAVGVGAAAVGTDMAAMFTALEGIITKYTPS
jgi:Flp pilus assembly pilin Flp